ncbi:unnamed protein product [Rangifer tarandus platyrhynchus]|uniref:Uncharacterized protein n=1 Tax=Rangifer tarandus platyrhynchus TaxID=3082113 RepID=A0ABN9A0H2_RANTA|nr:unnamed protein product [Rangifer tarandus platyrhynchus]
MAEQAEPRHLVSLSLESEVQGLVSCFGRMGRDLSTPGVRTLPSSPDRSGCQSPPRTPPSGHDTLTEGKTSLVGETLGLYALHLGSPEGISPPRPGQRGQGREASVDTLPGPSLPTWTCASARRRWPALACLRFFKQEMPGCSSQGLCIGSILCPFGSRTIWEMARGQQRQHISVLPPRWPLGVDMGNGPQPSRSPAPADNSRSPAGSGDGGHDHCSSHLDFTTGQTLPVASPAPREGPSPAAGWDSG